MWGAISILLELEAAYGYAKKELPSASAIHRYLQSCGLIKVRIPKANLPNQQACLAEHPHDLWEMDAQGAVAVQGLGYISMINILHSTHKCKYIKIQSTDVATKR